MTESLKDVLDAQAASVAFKAPDVEAIARAGSRRIRRRRAVALLAAVTAVAVIAGTAATVFAPDDGRPRSVGTDPRPADGVSWAVGSTIHDGDKTVEVGHTVRAFVRTALGFVTLDNTDDVYSVTNLGVRRIGHAALTALDGTEQLRLFSDPRGTKAGWLGTDSSELVLQVHDQATGQTRTYRTGTTSPFGAAFFAIDDGTAYWRNAETEEVFAVDLDTGDQRRLSGADQAHNLEVFSVESGLLAFAQDYLPGNNVTSFRVGRSFDNSREFTLAENTEADSQIRLSPTGAWLSYLLYEFNGPPAQDDVRAFTAQVRDSATGEPTTLKLGVSASIALPAVWLDDTTLQLFALAEPQQAIMYRCTVPDGACQVAAVLPIDQVDGNKLVLPGGKWTGP